MPLPLTFRSSCWLSCGNGGEFASLARDRLALAIEELHSEPERLGGGGPQVRGQEGERCPGRIGNETRYSHLHGHERIGLSYIFERRVALASQVPRGGQQFERAAVERIELNESLRHLEQPRRVTQLV